MFSSLFGSKPPTIRELERITEPFSYESYGFCKRIIKKLSKLTSVFENEVLKVYEHNSKIIIYFTDDEFANILYEKQDLVKSFYNSSVVSVKKHSRVYFSIHDNCYFYTRPKADVFSEINSKISKFCKELSCVNYKVYIDYHKLFKLVCDNSIHFSLSLWLAITKAECVLTEEQLTDTIDCIIKNLYGVNYSYALASFKSNIELINWLQKGIYVKPCDKFYSTTEFSLRINFFKRLLNPDYFKDTISFFEDNYSGVEKLGYDYIIVDDELFKAYITKSVDVGTFKYHYASDNLIFLQDGTFNSSSLEYAYQNLNRNSLLLNANIIFNVCTKERYLFFKTNSDVIPLKSYIEQKVTSKAACNRLICLLLDTFSKFNDDIWLLNSDALLDCISITKNGSRIFFDNLHNLAMDRDENIVLFNHYLTIMMVLKIFIEKNLLTASDLFSCNFYKILPFKFVKTFEDYLSSGILPCKNRRENFTTIPFHQTSYIEFLENIPMDDKDLIQSIAFFNFIVPNDKINAILEARHDAFIKDSPNINGVKPVELNSLLNKYSSPLMLSKASIEELTQAGTEHLSANTIIISRDYTLNDTYQIVGAICNKSKVYNIFDLIKGKAINTKQIYQIIATLVNYPFDTVSKFRESNPIILIDENLNPYINAFGLYTEGTGFEELRNYRYLFHEFQAFTIKHWGYFEDFGFKVRDKYDLNRLLSNIDTLEFCKTHNMWHFAGSLCPMCEKIYLREDVPGLNTLDVVYQNDISKFYLFKGRRDDFIFCRQKRAYSKQIIERVELGITHDLYNNFVGIAPSKLLLSYGKTYGIVFSPFDFKGLVNIHELKSTQRLKFILVLYSKLLPKILDGSFVCSNGDIFETMFMHNMYKGCPIIPNIYLMESEIILSNDEQLKATKKDKTLYALSSFLLKYIIDDDFLNSRITSMIPEYVEVINSIKQKNFDAAVIKACLSLDKNCCTIHNYHFSDKEGTCIHCKASGINSDDMIFLSPEHFDTLENPLYDGGEADLYKYSSSEVQKIFKEGTNLKFKSDIIGKVLQKRKIFEEFNANHSDIQFVMVKKVLYSAKNGTYTLKGYTQDNIKNSFKISCLKDREFVKRLGYTTQDIVQILINVCIGIEFIHKNGGFIGDLNGGNILIKDKVVYFIDFDGMSFDDVKNCVYTNTYIYPPSAENNNITKDDDWYSLAVQAFYYLTYSHPFRGACDNEKVPKNNEVERMKLGYSVLGNHGIKLPSVSIGWSHLSRALIDFFIATFEGSKRESMLEVLRAYLKHVSNAQLTFSEIKRKQKALLTLSENTYLSVDNIIIHKESSLLSIPRTTTFYLSKGIMWFVFNGSTYVLNDTTGELYQFNKVYGKILDVQNNKIFYTIDSGYTIKIDELNSDGTISTLSVRQAFTGRILSLRAADDNKLILIEKAHYKLNIYGNSEKICSIEQNQVDEDIPILCDEISGNWLVLLKSKNSTTGVVIQGANKYFTFELHERLPGHVKFYGNTIYYPVSGKICYYNINSKRTNYIPCDVADESCIIDRKENKFIICNKGSSHVYTKA